jgi:hypothetical protein
MSLGSHSVQRNWGPRLREFVYHGLRLIVLENERMRIGVLAGKGTDVVELNFKPRDLDFAWLTAGGVRNPLSYLSTSPDQLATFIDTYAGGWQEIFPNGGAPSTYQGAQFGQHGEVCNLPWDVRLVEDSEQAVAVAFLVRTQKTPYLIEKELRLVAGEATLHVRETITNESDVPLHAMWGHHLAFGRPFLDETCRIRLPDGVEIIPHDVPIHPDGRRVRAGQRTTWPFAEAERGSSVDLSVLPPRGTLGEIVYLTSFPNSEGWYEIVHPGNEVGFRVEWDAARMPYLWFWQEFGASTGYPWYGRHYNVGLEPFSSYPTNGLAEAVANGTALTFGPREQKSFWLRASIVEHR